MMNFPFNPEEIKKALNNIGLSNPEEFLQEISVTGTAGAGLVTVTLTGTGECTAVHIADELFTEESPTIQGLLIAAFNAAREALKQEIQKQSPQKMANLFEGLFKTDDK